MPGSLVQGVGNIDGSHGISFRSVRGLGDERRYLMEQVRRDSMTCAWIVCHWIQTHCCTVMIHHIRLLLRSSVLIPGARFQIGYFLVDIYAMYQVTKWSLATSESSLSARVTRLLQRKFLFIVHHLLFVLSCLTLLVSCV